MCGIVGYCGSKNAMNLILKGLEKLEYRGYDSAGISIIGKDKIKTSKKSGKLINLKNSLENHPIKGSVGIGHTRWATHGEPNEINAHPHLSNNGRISVVHNGIIENYLELKTKLENLGFKFKSQTDTEVVAILIEYYYDGNLLNSVLQACKELKGSYAIAVVSIDNPDELIAVRNQSPLVIGLCDEGNFIASDVSSVIEYTNDVIYLNNSEIVELNSSNNEYKIYDFKLNEIKKEISKVDWSFESVTKEGYDHFMMKEIFEQPRVVKSIITKRYENNILDLKDSSFNKDELFKINKIFVVACGTALHAGEIGKYIIKKFAKIPVYSEIASEFRHNENFIDENTLIIVVSQSGETADTLGAMREAKEKGAKILAITNSVNSSIARESDKVMYCYAGPEISVASTKAYTAQLTNLYLLALDFAFKLGKISLSEIEEFMKELKTMPQKISMLLNDLSIYKNIANELKDEKSIYFTGRNMDFITAKESALKLKEISYIHTEAFASGELKHGSIALIENGTKVIGVSTLSEISDKTASNIEELSARGAKVFSITDGNNKALNKISSFEIVLPNTIDELKPMLAVIPSQLIAYFTSLLRGNDVDKPRNLAKAVTVE